MVQVVSGVERGVRSGLLLVILYLVWSTLHFIFIPWLWIPSQDTGRYGKEALQFFWASRIFLLVFTISCLMTVWSFLMAAMESPGLVETTLTKSPFRKTGSDARLHHLSWCRKCDWAKPARAHHCRSCKTCILRMDHHCPWIANCIGWNNQGHFLRFLSYASGSIMMAFLGTIIRLVKGYQPAPMMESESSIWDVGVELNETDVVVSILNLCLLGALGIFVTLLAGFQWANVIRNRTTIEDLEIANNPSAAFPYQLRPFWRNLRSILGGRYWAWPFPFVSSWQLEGLGDGVNFESTNLDPWPPLQHLDADDEVILSRRERFRRGSEGYLIPADQIGVQPQATRFNSAPLLIERSERIECI